LFHKSLLWIIINTVSLEFDWLEQACKVIPHFHHHFFFLFAHGTEWNFNKPLDWSI